MRHHIQRQTLDALLAQHRQGRDQVMLDRIEHVPVNLYTHPDVLRQEMTSVFRCYPMLVGHASRLQEPGSYLLSDWAKLPYVIVRDQEGPLRAFLNLCRHRGARLVSGREPCLKAFICPFHGWSYGLDGRLKGISKPYNFPDLDWGAFSLIELPVVERAGLVWIHPTPGAAIDLDRYLGSLGDDLDHFKLDDLARYRKTRVIKQANWKLLIKTYLEGYHVPYLHRDTLSQAFRQGVIVHDEVGPHIRLVAARTQFSERMKCERAKRDILDVASVYYAFFPHAFFIMHPDYVSINLFYPEAPDRTLWTHEMLYRPERFEGGAGQKALEKRFRYTNDTVFDEEDFAVAEGVQAGLVYGGNTVHTLGLEEGLLAMFQQNIETAIRTHDLSGGGAARASGS